jgi:hypothetical protein
MDEENKFYQIGKAGSFHCGEKIIRKTIVNISGLHVFHSISVIITKF